MGQYILALEQGSLNSKATLIDNKGKIIAQGEHPLRPIYLKSGWIEYRPADILKSQQNAIKALFRKIGNKKRQIAAAGFAGQRSTIILWDKDTGKPIYNSISYTDPRGTEICKEKVDYREIVRERTGLILSPYYSASKIKWVLENTKSAQKLLEKGRLLCGPVNTYLMWHLTKGAAFTIDHASAAQTLLCNIFTKSWDKELLELFNIPPEILPSILPTSVHYGDALIEGQTIPIHASTAEQQASLIGHGLFQEGDVHINYNSTGFILTNTGKKIFLLPGLLTTIAWSNGDNTTYMLEGIINSAGSILEWMQTNLGIIKQNDDIDKLCREAAGRLFMFPSVSSVKLTTGSSIKLTTGTGAGSPYRDTNNTTCIYGLKSSTAREDLVRAAVESIAFLVKDTINVVLADGRIPLKRMIASGKVADIPYLLQFQADILRIPLHKAREGDSIALGVAFLAGLSRRVWQGVSSVERLTPTVKTFNPKIAEQDAVKLYDRWRLTCYHSKEWSKNFS